MAEIERLRILIKGQVQGVGFRPHVYRVAQHLNLTGWVQNNTIGVLIEVQGWFVSSFLSLRTMEGRRPRCVVRDRLRFL